MKKILLAVLCATSTTTFADSMVFEGLSIDLSAGYQKTERDSSSTVTEITGGVPTVNANSMASVDDSNTNMILGAAYNFALNNNYLLGVGFDYDFADHNIGNPIIDNDPTDNGVNFELSNAMSLYLKPQLMITDKSQVYAKLAYIRADVDATEPGEATFVGSDGESIDGYSIGAGYANMIAGNVSLFVEANYFNYGGEEPRSNYTTRTLTTPTDIEGYNAKIGIAYTFK
jgi:outer membrane immunogenic protein